MRRDDVVFVDIDYRIFCQAPHALADVSVLAVGRIDALGTDGKRTMIVACCRLEIAVEGNRGIERQVDLAGDGVVSDLALQRTA